MKLSDYLDAKGESQEAFAARATRHAPPGRTVSQRTISRIIGGTVCNAATALAIIKATRDEPTDDGATVTLEDLAIGDDPEQGSSLPAATAA